jgi:hypothetical protein
MSMRWGVALRALGFAAAILACGIGRAVTQNAEDNDDDAAEAEQKTWTWPLLLDPEPFAVLPRDVFTGMPDRLIYFTGFDVWRAGFGGYMGVQWAPNRIDRDGFIVRLFGSDSMERYVTRAHRFETQTMRGALLAGYQFQHAKFVVQVLGGIDVEADLPKIDRRDVRPTGRVGARITTDVWWEPTPQLMLQYAFSVGSIGPDTGLRAAAGWRLLDRFWVGPEVSAWGDQYGRQYRVGAHLTGLRTGDYEWSFSAGYVEDDFQRSGAYGRIGILLRPPRPLLFEN